MRRVSRIAVDLRPLRESRDFRLLTAGSLITGWLVHARYLGRIELEAERVEAAELS